MVPDGQKVWTDDAKTISLRLRRGIKRRYGKDKDSIVNKTEYQSKINPTGKTR